MSKEEELQSVSYHVEVRMKGQHHTVEFITTQTEIHLALATEKAKFLQSACADDPNKSVVIVKNVIATSCERSDLVQEQWLPVS